MPYTIRLANNAGNFIVIEGETILEAAWRQGFEIPYSCGEGICGSCEGNIIDGYVTHINLEHLALDEEDLLQGKTLFCSTKPASDLLIDAPGITIPAPHETKLIFDVKSHHPISDDVFEVILSPRHEPLHFLAGQYVKASFANEEARPFSIANKPNEAHEVHLHIRVQQHNEYAKKLLEHIKHHKEVILSAAKGHCLYHPEPHMPSVFLAVGTGFAPFKAILETAFENNNTQPITLYWAGKYEHDLYQFALTHQWQMQYANFKFVPILLADNAPTPYTSGHILDILLEQQPDLSQHHIYLAGPPQLTVDAIDRLSNHGAQLCYMYSDAFEFIL